ncbi:MAG: hypothetical protein GY757_21825 [bacterium]|nr:hypothetical protein [bacterium]
MREKKELKLTLDIPPHDKNALLYLFKQMAGDGERIEQKETTARDSG